LKKKPCDTYSEQLPCDNPNNTLCLGAAVWGKKPTNGSMRRLEELSECPHIESVRAYWRMNAAIGNVSKLKKGA
jgi:hypothetical protein